MKTNEPLLPHQSVKEPAGTDMIREALDPFARVFRINQLFNFADSHPLRDISPGTWPTFGDCRRANEALGAPILATPDEAPVVNVSSKKEGGDDPCRIDVGRETEQSPKTSIIRASNAAPTFNPKGAAVGASTKEEWSADENPISGNIELRVSEKETLLFNWRDAAKLKRVVHLHNASLASRGQE